MKTKLVLFPFEGVPTRKDLPPGALFVMRRSRNVAESYLATLETIVARKHCSILEVVFWHNVTPKDNISPSTALADVLFKYHIQGRGIESNPLLELQMTGEVSRFLLTASLTVGQSRRVNWCRRWQGQTCFLQLPIVTVEKQTPESISFNPTLHK